MQKEDRYVRIVYTTVATIRREEEERNNEYEYEHLTPTYRLQNHSRRPCDVNAQVQK